ncbi:MICOS complex subunit MIC60 [Sphingobium sp. CAP-1]|uniref:MICOS complex subunit MIC60 n=1 Tax=Sphingobium sp. CAP-1 TaxID=2676077 RepID=UPI001E3AF217|nr:MICOS complex subunit MIC60 [Sphingobium sp. CAP-1]
MSEEDGAASIGSVPPPVRRRSLLPILILALLAFALGVVLTVWAWPQIQRRWGDPQPQAALPQPLPGTMGALGVSQGVTVKPLTVDAGQMLDARVAQLEERLNRISVEAQAASGNAARAEGLLVAFAARRALDNGAPLGYVEGQLRLRFGQAQPRAVAAIISAARDPITLTDLRAGLVDIADKATRTPADARWWTALEHEARELVTIRKASTPSPRPQAAMERALRYVDGGRVSAALAEVERLPGKASADRWVQAARRYLEARRALDLIETAAILEPRQLRSAEGAAVSQTSPLAP